nr:MAG TPA: hypothetical protein [Caudoviricetes sp.]
MLLNSYLLTHLVTFLTLNLRLEYTSKVLKF